VVVVPVLVEVLVDVEAVLVVATVPAVVVEATSALVTTVPVAFNFSALRELITSTLSTVADDIKISLSSANTWNNDPKPEAV